MVKTVVQATPNSATSREVIKIPLFGLTAWIAVDTLEAVNCVEEDRDKELTISKLQWMNFIYFVSTSCGLTGILFLTEFAYTMPKRKPPTPIRLIRNSPNTKPIVPTKMNIWSTRMNRTYVKLGDLDLIHSNAHETWQLSFKSISHHHTDEHCRFESGLWVFKHVSVGEECEGNAEYCTQWDEGGNAQIGVSESTSLDSTFHTWANISNEQIIIGK